MYAPRGVQWTGTNRPRTCPTHHHCPHKAPQVNHGKTQAKSVLASTHCTPPTPHHTRFVVGVVRCSGGHSGGETPGPIPNPEAKPSSADGTATDRSWESRTPPEHPTTATTPKPPPNQPGAFVRPHPA